MSVQYGPISAEQLEDFHAAMSVPFGFDPTPTIYARFRGIAEVDRLRAATDDGQIVATFGAYSLMLTVPGGRLATAGTTNVTVLPTHRRRGILRTLMTEHLSEVHQRGEPLAALWASESSIYGRFGYGPASERATTKLDKPFAKLRRAAECDDSMRLVGVEEAFETFPRVFRQVCVSRPGMFDRDDNWWRNRILEDTEDFRFGATAHRRVAQIRDGEPVGYVIYRTKTDSARGKNSVQVVELMGVDAEAEKSLWQHVFGIDLIDEIEHWNQPVDDSLRWWLEQPRRMQRIVEDSLWVRTVDVPAALQGRRYTTAGDVRFSISDDLCPWNDGTYRLAVDECGAGQCTRSQGPADVELTPFALGAAYLGGVRFSDLARSGEIVGDAVSLRKLDSMFAWDPLPWCPEVF